MIRIKESLALYNSKASKDKKLNLQKLGLILYKDSNYASINVLMHRLTTGRAKSIKLEMVQVLCDTLGVDPNFLFGFPSEHDK
jgi:hypothetical protein